MRTETTERKVILHLEQGGFKIAFVTGPPLAAWDLIWDHAQLSLKDGPVTVIISEEDMEAVAAAQGG